MQIIAKPWANRIDGRILVIKHNKVVLSLHYRDMEHREVLIKEIKEIL